MSEQLNWQQAILGERDKEAAQTLIATINDLLQDNTSEVVRQIASELTLSLRNIRHKIQKMDYECSPEHKTLPLTLGVTLTSYNQDLLELIADSRQLTDLLAFYAMALSEQSSRM